MSATPVSVAADRTPTSRRRNVPIAPKISVLDFAGSDTIAASPVTSGDHSKGKDLSRSVRTETETVLERSIDAGTGTIKGRRTTAKKSKPLWKTVLSVFTKNLLLVIVLGLSVQMFRKLAFNQFVSPDYENRIAELDAFLKTTTKMIQVRVDSVDEKIHNEIDGLKTELSKRIVDNRAEFSNQLQELDERIESMEESSREWLCKDEFDRFMEDFKDVKVFDNIGDLKLDEIRVFAREIVEKEIEKHADDGLGMVDYAVASGGAMVVEHSDAILGKVGWLYRNRISSDAVKMLQPSFGEPGQCLALKGNSGFVQIKLRSAIIPEAITLEHVAKSVAFDRSSAPKKCRVFGWLHNKGTMHQQLLTEFVYDLEKSNAQTFNVLDTRSSSIIDTIRLDFTSNHGNPTHTCIYRLRVHGQEPRSLSSLALDS